MPMMAKDYLRQNMSTDQVRHGQQVHAERIDWAKAQYRKQTPVTKEATDPRDRQIYQLNGDELDGGTSWKIYGTLTNILWCKTPFFDTAFITICVGSF